MQRLHLPSKYYLQVVKNGESPRWPRPEDELVVGGQDISGGFTQYWAYFKDDKKAADDLPPAEETAARYPTPKPAILIDQLVDDSELTSAADTLELILVRDGHALSRTDSSLDNLEDNLTSMLDFAHRKLELKVEHFMTSEGVSKIVEKKLDELEEMDDDLDKVREKPVAESANDVPSEEHNEPHIKQVGAVHLPTSGIYSSTTGRSRKKDASAIWLVLPVVLLVGALITTVLFKDQIISKFSSFQLGALVGKKEAVEPVVSPSPEPTATPTPITVERGEFSLRVLNGTTTSGAAGTLGKKLEGLGWKVSKVGNAPKQDLEKTIIRAKKEMEDAAIQLVADVKDELAPTTSFDLPDSEKVDVEIVIGKE